MSKFKVGDEVALRDPSIANLFTDPSFIVRSISNLSTLHMDKYFVQGTNSNDIRTFKTENLYLYSPENRTKILLGIDLED